MRLLHTADWHLGQTLHGVPRTYEHARFLSWLLTTLGEQAIDALLIAGDVFDSASPPPAAQEQYYQFLAAARRLYPRLQVVVVGGNHDSAARLDAPAPVLQAIGVKVIGGLLPDDPPERAVVPLLDASGEEVALLLAVPFLRPRDLPGVADPNAPAQQRLVEGHRSLYRRLTEFAEGRRRKGQALLATGHAYLQGGMVSELSERKIQMGNQQALPVDVFSENLAYVALGHLHRAQAVGGRETVRYSGSPIPLSMTERDYPHQVVLVELEGERVQKIEPLLVPRSVELIAVPEAHLLVERVKEILRDLPKEAPPGVPPEARPLYEVRVWLEEPRPHLKAELESAMEGVFGRLVRIDVKRPDRRAPEVPLGAGDLSSLSPVEVFKAAYARERKKVAAPELVGLFEGLLDELLRGER